MIACHKMTEASMPGAFDLLKTFLGEDQLYLDSSEAYGDAGEGALTDALRLFLRRPHLGFVWVAQEGEEAVGVCVVCFAISTSLGTLVVKLDDMFVKAGWQSQGIGSRMMADLKRELWSDDVRRIDTSVHLRNPDARRFYERHGFVPLNEERLSCVLTDPSTG